MGLQRTEAAPLVHFYHLWAAGAWREPVEEHWRALHEADWSGAVQVGMVGSVECRREAVAWLSEQPVRFEVITEAAEGHEEVTLERVRHYAQGRAGSVMYAHTKGAYDSSEFRHRWRRTMCHDLIGNWEGNLHVLEKGHDALGPFWLTPGMFPNQIDTPFFGGNYWLAKCSYLRRLPRIDPSDRFNSERWIGLGSPNAVDLRPGWPGTDRFLP